jgi:hypothetical protein
LPNQADDADNPVKTGQISYKSKQSGLVFGAAAVTAGKDAPAPQWNTTCCKYATVVVECVFGRLAGAMVWLS